MITKETCLKIWQAYQEIENAEKLLESLADILKKEQEKDLSSIHNAFGERRGMELIVNTGTSGESFMLCNVSPTLSVGIIENHIQSKRKRLEELKSIAKIELYGKEASNG